MPADPGADLLAAILADPESETVPQVYADELIRRGDPRGELIAVERALDGGVSIRKRVELEAHRAALRRDHAATWWPYALSGFRTKGGFIRAITGSYAQIARAAEALFAAEPVVEVTITDADEELAAELAEAPWLARVRHLILRGELGDAGFASLVASEQTAGLTALNVTATGLGSGAPAALGANLSGCRTLVLSGNPIGDEGVAGLRAWEHLGTLEVLYLSGCELSVRGVATLLDGAPLAALTKLCLSNNALEDAGHRIAARTASLPALRHLELIDTRLGRDGIQALIEAPMPHLDRIDVRRNGGNDFADHAPRVRTGR
jgi:uncharacterized protein (TIGR02996 family)